MALPSLGAAREVSQATSLPTVSDKEGPWPPALSPPCHFQSYPTLKVQLRPASSNTGSLLGDLKFQGPSLVIPLCLLPSLSLTPMSDIYLSLPFCLLSPAGLQTHSSPARVLGVFPSFLMLATKVDRLRSGHLGR